MVPISQPDGSTISVVDMPKALPAILRFSNTRALGYFGYSVSLSGDTLAVGSYVESSNATGIDGDQTNTSAAAAGAAAFAAGGNPEGGGGPADAREGPASLAQWAELHELMDGLPPEEREVVGLLFYQGLSQAEAAEVLGVSLRTVQRRWHDALCRLHRAWAGE